MEIMFVVMALGFAVGIAFSGLPLRAGVALALTVLPPIGACLAQLLELSAWAWIGPAVVWFATPFSLCYGVRAARRLGWRTMAGAAACVAIAEALAFSYLLLATWGLV